MGDEPNAASTWIPISDHPADKATLDVPRDGARRASASSPTASCAASARATASRPSSGTSRSRWRTTSSPPTSATGSSAGPHARRHPGDRGGRPDAATHVNGRSRALDFFYDTTAEATDLWSADLRPLPVRLDRRDRRQRQLQRPGDRLLAGDADPAAVLQRAQPSTIAHELAHQWFGDSVSVADVAQHLAQRGLRDLRAVPVGRAQRHPERPRAVPGRLRRGRPTRPSGRSRWPTRSATRCSPAPSTAAAA